MFIINYFPCEDMRRGEADLLEFGQLHNPLPPCRLRQKFNDVKRWQKRYLEIFLNFSTLRSPFALPNFVYKWEEPNCKLFGKLPRWIILIIQMKLFRLTEVFFGLAYFCRYLWAANRFNIFFLLLLFFASE